MGGEKIEQKISETTLRAPNICVIEIPKKRKEDEGDRKIFEEIMAKCFRN